LKALGRVAAPGCLRGAEALVEVCDVRGSPTKLLHELLAILIALLPHAGELRYQMLFMNVGWGGGWRRFQLAPAAVVQARG
jgi:hypothetical protein